MNDATFQTTFESKNRQDSKTNFMRNSTQPQIDDATMYRRLKYVCALPGRHAFQEKARAPSSTHVNNFLITLAGNTIAHPSGQYIILRHKQAWNCFFPGFDHGELLIYLGGFGNMHCMQVSLQMPVSSNQREQRQFLCLSSNGSYELIIRTQAASSNRDA